MKQIRSLEVVYHNRRVGIIALNSPYQMAFQYDRDWLRDGFSISPFKLPLEEKVFLAPIEPFKGIFGCFYDSLPDGWGRLLVDRQLENNGIDFRKIDNLTRLAIVGNSGMGALEYIPTYELQSNAEDMTLDEMAEKCAQVLVKDSSEDLDKLFQLGGSSGGARPKIMTKIDGEDWIIKFPSSEDSKEIGNQEYQYYLCARKCGIEMEESRLFPSKKCLGYFGTKRFDRVCGSKVHMLSVSGLLDVSHRVPTLDYNVLMKLTLELTKSFEDVKKMFRLMCFNVYAHNRDDHSNNFSYLYCEEEERWVLSPAYDLIYSNSIGGEHATTINGNGKNPGLEDILQVAQNIGLNLSWARKTAYHIEEKTRMLSDYQR